MKLRNKKTGEITDLTEGFIRDTYNGEMIQIKPVAINNKEGYVYGSLAELNEDWEDYEEPKDFWYIEPNGVIARIDEWDCCTDSDIGIMKTLGNYFDTREEAEKAVEKLKVWKRLKDKGFRIKGWTIYDGLRISICTNTDEDDIYDDDKRRIKPDLDLLFGDEE